MLDQALIDPKGVNMAITALGEGIPLSVVGTRYGKEVMVAALACLQFLSLPGCGESEFPGKGASNRADLLIATSKAGKSLMESKALLEGPFPASALLRAKDYVELHPNHTSYHLLFAVRRHSRDLYSQISTQAKAKTLCSALERAPFLNDWGYLAPDGGSYDGEAAEALLEIPRPAVQHLEGVLRDRRPAHVFGSEEATMSHVYHYRRADFAYRYICLILGRKPTFDPDPTERDNAIRKLIEELGS